MTLSKTYDPHSFESEIYKRWEDKGVFRADNTSKAPAHYLHASSNATGQLHVGHAVMLALEDILIRWHRMKGDEVLWLPGTDHAAIATENVVLNQIRNEEGIQDPETLGGRKCSEELLHMLKITGTIRNQVKAMGSSCDWSRGATPWIAAKSLSMNRLSECTRKT